MTPFESLYRCVECIIGVIEIVEDPESASSRKHWLYDHSLWKRLSHVPHFKSYQRAHFCVSYIW